MSPSNRISYVFHLIAFSLFVLSNGVTVDDINQLRTELRALFDSDIQVINGISYRATLASVVRLVFHDCSGPGAAGNPTSQCNGCIDFENEDHAGLVERAIDPLDGVYTGSTTDWETIIPSRADFWAAAGIINKYNQHL